MMGKTRDADVLALAREMARSGDFQHCVPIEAALIIHGYGDELDLLSDISLRSELDSLCKDAQAKNLTMI